MTGTETIDMAAGTDFILKIRGDFAAAEIKAGDILGVAKQSTAEDGQIAVAKTLADEWTLLIAPAPDDCEIKGRVVWFRRDLP